MNNKRSNSLAFTSIITAISASLCCITPVLALIAGSSGIAATFAWLNPFRPWLIGITVTVLAFAWYQKIRPRTVEEIACACENDERPSFWQSKKFLGIVTIFTAIMLAFPFYASSFYPDTKLSESVNIDRETTYEINISGMTCTGCEELVKLEVGKLQGISELEVSYENSSAVVTFDKSTLDIEKIKETINQTGYKVESANKSK